jgi:hypothetical protein
MTLLLSSTSACFSRPSVAADCCQCTGYVKNCFGVTSILSNAKDIYRNIGFGWKCNPQCDAIYTDCNFGHMGIVDKITSIRNDNTYFIVREANRDGSCFTGSNCYNSGHLNTNNNLRRYDTNPEMINWSLCKSDSDQNFDRIRSTIISVANYTMLQNRTTKYCLNFHYGVNSRTNVWTPCDSRGRGTAWSVTNLNDDLRVLNIPFEQQSKHKKQRQDCSGLVSFVNRCHHVSRSLNRVYQIGMSRVKDFNISLVNAIIHQRSKLGAVVACMIRYRSKFVYDLVYSETTVTE